MYKWKDSAPESYTNVRMQGFCARELYQRKNSRELWSGPKRQTDSNFLTDSTISVSKNVPSRGPSGGPIQSERQTKISFTAGRSRRAIDRKARRRKPRKGDQFGYVEPNLHPQNSKDISGSVCWGVFFDDNSCGN